MSGNAKWWLNRAGTFAPVSSPGSNVPNYGLTFDVATAPWDDQAQFNALVSSQLASRVMGAAQGIFGKVTQPAQFEASPKDPTVWDRVTGAASAAGHVVGEGIKGVTGGVDALADKFGADATLGDKYDKLSAEADKQGLKGWDRLKFIGGQDLASAGKNLTEDPLASKVFWALDKASEYGATAFVAGTEAQKHGGMFWDSDNMGRAHDLVKKYDLNAGEGFVQMFYDDEMIDDEKRFAEIRKHSTVFNTGALAFNVTMAWKFDPNVMLGKAGGAVRDLRRGKLADTGAAAGIQRDILAQTNRADAELLARNAGGFANRVRANHALTLWDKSQKLREAAQGMGYEDFKRLAPFTNSASGVVMSKLLQDVAHDDDAWNLVFRASIGDKEAMPTLLAQRADLAPKIDALELGRLPRLEADFEDVATRYEKRLAEQGGMLSNNDRLILTSQRDWFLDQDFQTAKVRLDEAKAELSAYKDHESWLTRTTRGMDDSRQSGAIFNTLDSLNPVKGTREAMGDRIDDTLYALGGKVSSFRKDEFSRLSRVITAPRKPMLKRVGVVNLHDVDEGAQGVAAYLDQFTYMAGRQDQGLRDHILSRWAGSTTDVERKQIVDELEGQGIALVLKKHGITTPEMRQRVREVLQGKRADAWSNMSDSARYTTLTDETGKRLDKRVFEYEDDQGTVTKVAMPMDPTELPNWRPLTNLTDLDHALAVHKDMFKELDRAHALGVQSRRLAEEVYETVGSTLNTLWKPAALISLRWPARVVADESFRVMLMLGVLPHMKAWGEGVSNVLHNTGFVKPVEFFKGRKIKTGSFAEESLRSERAVFDPWDGRAATNPQAAVPADAADFGKIDPDRHERLLAQAAEQREWLRKGQMGEKPRWAQRFEDRVAAAEKADSRGFFFDPINGRAKNKGFAVSVYPGRLRTFDEKPSAAELHWWTEKNADLLANHDNQVAVWLDKETSRWHLDIVRTARRREDAMMLAAKAEAPDFFDINDGFTRYMAEEDRFGHAQYAAKGLADLPEGEVPGTPVEAVPAKSQKRRLGVGTKVYKTADGRKIEVEDVYGANADDMNIYFAAHSAKGMAQRLYGGYTKGLGTARVKRSGNGARTIHFSDEADNWRIAQSEYVNKHFRNSPIWLKMLDGQSDKEVLSWLTSTPEGRQLRQRMGPRGMNPHRWVQDMRAIFDHTLPTAQARLAAKTGDVDPKAWDDLIPEDLRGDVHGDTILMAAGEHPIQGMWKRFVEKSFDVLGSMPTDALVRHPFARNLYNLRMKNYLASIDGEVTQEVLNAAEASARAFATKQVRRLLYNIADENQAVHMLRFVAPFFQAQAEVLERYAHLFSQKPEALARTLQMFYLSQNDDPRKGLWYTVDKDGNPTSRFSHDNQVVLQIKPWMHHIPGLKQALAHKTELPIPVSSIDLILQGETPYLPSLGPLVTIPATELIYAKHPDRAEGKMFNWFFPFGTPTGDTIGARTSNALMPAWMRRVKTAASVGYEDSAFANSVNIRYQDIAFEWEKEHGKTVPGALVPKLTKQAEAETRAYWWLRAFASFASPVPIGDRSPHQHWIDMARKYRAKYGMDADQKFYDEVGPDFFRYFTESTRSTNGLAPTTAAAKGYLKNKELVDKAPDLAGIIAGPYSGDGDFNYEVYRWQLRTRKGPGSSETMRELQTPAERIAEGQINQGWIEYGKVATAVDAEMRARGLTSLNSNAALDLRAFKAAKVREVIERNPAWQKAYRSREDNLSGWLSQATIVASDKSMDGRTDIQGLRDYLISREKVQSVLFYRQANGGSASLSAEANADLGGAWNSYLSELTSKNLLFAEIYHRYLEGDDLTVVVN